jgi:hypothetical protein
LLSEEEEDKWNSLLLTIWKFASLNILYMFCCYIVIFFNNWRVECSWFQFLSVDS